MNITYNSVSYLDETKQSLHFTNLIMNDDNYGDVIISIKSDLGSQLQSYILENVGAIPIETVGTANSEMSNESVKSALKDGLYNHFDDIAKNNGYQNMYDLLSFTNSDNKNIRNLALSFQKYRSKALTKFEELDKEDKLKELGIEGLILQIGVFRVEDFSNDVETLKSELLNAILNDDQEHIKKLKEQYKNIVL